MKLSGALFLLCGAVALAQDQSRPVPIGAVPPAVQITIQGQLAGGKMGDVFLDDSRGDKTYDVQIVKDGQERSLSVAGDGRLISKEVTLEETPAALQKAIKYQVGPGTLTGIEQMLDQTEATYEVSIQTNGQERSFTFAGNGSLLSKEVKLEEAPPAVQKTIREQIGKGDLLGIDLTLGDENSYDVEAKLDGKFRSFSVAEEGVLLSMSIELADLAPAVRNAITGFVGRWVITSMEKSLDGKEVTYEVEVTNGPKSRDLSFGPDGALQSMEVDLTETPAPVQKTIQQHLEGGAVGRIDRVADGNAMIYQVEVNGGHKVEFEIGQAGEFLRGRVRLEQTPPPVRKTILGAIGAGKLLRIDESYGPGEHGYSIQSRKDGKEFDFAVGPKGKYLGEE